MRRGQSGSMNRRGAAPGQLRAGAPAGGSRAGDPPANFFLPDCHEPAVCQPRIMRKVIARGASLGSR